LVVTGFCALLFFGILGAGAVGVWLYRQSQTGVIEIGKADTACRNWLLTDPQILQELGPPTLGYSIGSETENAEDGNRAAAQFKFGISGPKSRGDIQVWLDRSPGGAWGVIGAVLTRAGQAPVKIGKPPEASQTTGKAN
jgi:hypothetical protein